MNKLLITTAALTAMSMASISVMAAGPTLYGKVHTSINYNDNNGEGNNDYSDTNLSSNNSRIGIKGSEDLGNGMQVGYLIEWGVDMAGDGDDLTERNRAITLSGDWGTALVGKWDTPFKTTGRKFDVFNDTAGDTRNLSKFDTTDNRADNVLAYTTPNMNGFSASAAYVFDSGLGDDSTDKQYSDDNADNNAYSVGANYNNGPVLIGVAYVEYNSDGNTGANVDDASAWRVGGAYTFSDFKVLASYTDFESQDFEKGNDPSLWTVGGTYNLGSNIIKAQYSDLDESNSGEKDGAEMWSVGIDHVMSKRTTVYALYASTDNDDNADRTSWYGTSSAKGALGQNADTFSIGMIHKF